MNKIVTEKLLKSRRQCGASDGVPFTRFTEEHQLYGVRRPSARWSTVARGL